MNGVTGINPALRMYAQPVVNQPVIDEPVNLKRLNPSELQTLSGTTSSGKTSTETVFDRLLTDLIQQTNAKQLSANQAVNDLLSGKDVSLHQVVIAMEEANVSFTLMVEVRNKLVEAYQELMRLQI